MSQSRRLAQGGRIDRNQPLTFTFNGQALTGYAGDTLASALLANGIDVVGRSFKLHRPRGIVAANAAEPNAIMQVSEGATVRPDQRATQVELYAGLKATTASKLGFDPLAINDVFSALFPAGFYYKTFMWPHSFWPKYEHRIRKVAGLGFSPRVADPARYEKMNTHVDVLVVGAGPAGLAAALTAARSGARVMLVDEQNEPGGSLLDTSDVAINDKPALEWVREVYAELEGMPEVRLLQRSTAFGHYDHNFVGILENISDHLGDVDSPDRLRQRFWRVRAKQVIHATGAHERPLVFANNDRPGVMLASAVSSYINRYGVAPGQRAVVFTNNDSAYQTALDMLAVGIEVAAVVDSRAHPQGELTKKVRGAGVAIHSGSVVSNVRGRRRVQQVEVRSYFNNKASSAAQRIDCDLLACSGGWSPVVHLHCHTGGQPIWDDTRAMYLPPEAEAGRRSAGAVTGNLALDSCLQEGTRAGSEAAHAAGFDQPDTLDFSLPPAVHETPLEPLWLVPDGKGSGRSFRQFVDLQNDATAADIELAVREGYTSVQHVKRYTGMGFGTDQGKLGNINGMGILAQVLKQPIAATGTTTFRPAYTPVTYGALAGRANGKFFQPIRRTPMHDWHVKHGALFEDVGQWKRAWYYPQAGESMQDALQRECLATRQHVGVLDASTLGKIEVHGKDANVFLDMIYTGGRRKMQTATCRYGLMLHEDGMIFNDGVTAKLDENHYLLTTTSGGAEGVVRWLEQWHQTEWPQMDVFITPVTEAWATISVNGPDSRRVLEAICSDVDFSNEAFRFMQVREGTVAGVAARIFRISFTGELAYEINVNANHGQHVWEAVMAAGETYGITPYGTETMHILRAEKGFIVAGHDTDGTMTPMDMGMSWAIGKKKLDFIGKRSLERPDIKLTDRPQFVGLKTVDPNVVLPEGAQLIHRDAAYGNPTPEHPVPMEGYVTSSYYSAALGRSIALAMVKGGFAREGEILSSPQPDGKRIDAEITGTIFYDPQGERQNV